MITERLGAGVRKGTQCPFSQKGPSSVLIHLKMIIAAVIPGPTICRLRNTHSPEPVLGRNSFPIPARFCRGRGREEERERGKRGRGRGIFPYPLPLLQRERGRDEERERGREEERERGREVKRERGKVEDRER